MKFGGSDWKNAGNQPLIFEQLLYKVVQIIQSANNKSKCICFFSENRGREFFIKKLKIKMDIVSKSISSSPLELLIDCARLLASHPHTNKSSLGQDDKFISHCLNDHDTHTNFSEVIGVTAVFELLILRKDTSLADKFITKCKHILLKSDLFSINTHKDDDEEEVSVEDMEDLTFGVVSRLVTLASNFPNHTVALGELLFSIQHNFVQHVTATDSLKVGYGSLAVLSGLFKSIKMDCHWILSNHDNELSLICEKLLSEDVVAKIIGQTESHSAQLRLFLLVFSACRNLLHRKITNDKFSTFEEIWEDLLEVKVNFHQSQTFETVKFIRLVCLRPIWLRMAPIFEQNFSVAAIQTLVMCVLYSNGDSEMLTTTLANFFQFLNSMPESRDIARLDGFICAIEGIVILCIKFFLLLTSSACETDKGVITESVNVLKTFLIDVSPVLSSIDESSAAILRICCSNSIRILLKALLTLLF